jgi:uncharacterized protein YdaU (DUF1376 family)
MSENPLPTDLWQLLRVCSAIAPEEQAAVEYILERFFEKSGDFYRHKRADEELKRSRYLSKTRREVGKKGLKTRHAIAHAIAHANGLANSLANDMQNTTQSQPQSQDKKESKKESQKRPLGGRTGDSNFFDFSIQIWTNAVAYLTSTGTDESDARGVIGKWRKEHSDEAILSALSKAEQNQAANPAGYVQTILNGKAKDYERARKHDDGLDWLRDIADGNATINNG